MFSTGPAPAVNRLVIVADNHHLTGIARQQTNLCVLNVVGIPEFVHRDVSKPLAIVLQDVRLVQP